MVCVLYPIKHYYYWLYLMVIYFMLLQQLQFLHFSPPFLFHKTTEFSPIKQFFKEVLVYVFLFMQSNTAQGTNRLHLTCQLHNFKKSHSQQIIFNRKFFQSEGYLEAFDKCISQIVLHELELKFYGGEKDDGLFLLKPLTHSLVLILASCSGQTQYCLVYSAIRMQSKFHWSSG